jgi:hypothetical protein
MSNNQLIIKVILNEEIKTQFDLIRTQWYRRTSATFAPLPTAIYDSIDLHRSSVR